MKDVDIRAQACKQLALLHQRAGRIQEANRMLTNPGMGLDAARKCVTEADKQEEAEGEGRGGGERRKRAAAMARLQLADLCHQAGGLHFKIR